MNKIKWINTEEEYGELLNQLKKDMFTWTGDCDVEEVGVENGKVLLKIKKKCAKNDGKAV